MPFNKFAGFAEETLILERIEMCTSNARVRVTISSGEKSGTSVGIRVLSVTAGVTVVRFPKRISALSRGVLVDLEPILSLVVVGLRHDQRNVEVLPDRGGMLSIAVALRSGFNALSSFGIEPS